MRHWWESISVGCIMSEMFTILLIVLSSRRGGDDCTHTINVSGTLSTSVGFRRPCPDSRKTFTFVFWLRGLIETVQSFQLLIVYVPVLLCMRPCLGWGERFLYFPSGLATVVLNTFMALKSDGCKNWTSVNEVCSPRKQICLDMSTFFIRALVSEAERIGNSTPTQLKSNLIKIFT